MERFDNGSQQTGQDSSRVWWSSSLAPAAVGVAAACSQETGRAFSNVPVFLDRTFTMIEQVPDEIMCWSRDGNSFIIKQVRASQPAPDFSVRKTLSYAVRAASSKRDHRNINICFRAIPRGKKRARTIQPLFTLVCGQGRRGAATGGQGCARCNHTLHANHILRPRCRLARKGTKTRFVRGNVQLLSRSRVRRYAN